MRTPVIAGNWKLNHGPARATAFFADLLPRLDRDLNATVAIFPPALSLAAARSALDGRPDVRLGVQNLYWEDSGAYTGEISAPMAREAGATLALIGHSERRHVFGETDEETARKVRAATAAGLTAVLCVGETLAERDAGKAFERIENQLRAGLAQLDRARIGLLLIAYEPVWAIGTGRTAAPADASPIHAHIRTLLSATFGEAAGRTPVLYGGSVKRDNAAQLLAAPDIDGLLIGGASLDPADFATICAMAG